MQELQKNQENEEEVIDMAGNSDELFENSEENAHMDSGVSGSDEETAYTDEESGEGDEDGPYADEGATGSDDDDILMDGDTDGAEVGVFGLAANTITQIMDGREKLVTILFWLFALSGVVISFQNGGRSGSDIAGGVVITVLCLMLYSFYIDISEFSNDNLFFLLCSGIFLGLSSVFNAPLFWIVFAVTAAVVDGIRLGMASFLLLFMEYLICLPETGIDRNRIIAVFLMGIAFVCLFSSIKERENMPTGKIFLMTGGIILCQSLVLYFVRAHFSIKEMTGTGFDCLMWMFGALFLYAVGIAVWFKYNRKQDGNYVPEEILSSEYELCQRMREYSEPLYQHSMRVSKLAGGACGEVGGDALLVEAAGLYHEIGRIRDEDVYIEEGLELCKAYQFPERLLEVISQHSTAFEKPKSIEAAVLMLTDCVVSTNEYLEKTGKRSGITDDKLVSIIFQNRIDKGNLSEAGITDEQLGLLKQYFTEHMADIRNSL